ncbi:MAG: toll/interleukin-1 receptor domain-containing protein [Streptosporangiaceae bacterium]
MAESARGASGRIFLNYRREETAYAAGWLYDRLAERFGGGQIFKDVDSIELGDDFVEKITRAVGSCDVLLALIGDRWLTIKGADGRRRLDDPEDFVRVEIEAAMARDIRVVPILVAGATIPDAGVVPPSLARLVRRQALELSPSRFDADLSRLLRLLDSTLAEVQAPPAGQRSGAAEREAAERQDAEWRAEREQVERREAEREARREAEWRAEREEGELRARQEAEREEGELRSRQEAEREEAELPVLVAGPIVLSIPLLIFSLELLTGHFSKPWSLVVLCSAILGWAVAAAENRRHRILVWTVALEFFFAWFLIYAMYRLNIGQIHRIHRYLPPLAILAAAGAIFSASLCIRALSKSTRKRCPVYQLLPAFLICMTVGLTATAIGYAGEHYHSVETLHNIGPKFTDIGVVFLFVALLLNLLAPLLALVRRLHGSSAGPMPR